MTAINLADEIHSAKEKATRGLRAMNILDFLILAFGFCIIRGWKRGFVSRVADFAGVLVAFLSLPGTRNCRQMACRLLSLEKFATKAVVAEAEVGASI